MAKAGRPKNVRPHEIRIHVPKDTLKNRAKRLYWVLLEYEKKMSKDITSVRAKDYTDILTAYTEVCEELRKKGYVGRYAKAGVEQQSVVQDEHENSTSADSGKRSSGVGVGVSPPNPLTE